METLYVLNIFFFISISIIKILYLTKSFNFSFLNPISLPFIISLPVFMAKTFVGPFFVLREGLFDIWFQYALLMTNVYLLGEYLLTIIVIKFCNRSSFIKNRLIKRIRPIKIKRIRMIISSFFFFFLFFICFILLSKEFGMINWILNPREGYQHHRVGVGHWYALSLLFLSTSYTITALYAKKLIHLILVTFVYIYFVFLLGSKDSILSFATFFMIVLWFRRSKYFTKILYITIPLGFTVMLLNFNPKDVMDIVQYFDYYINSAMYYKAYFNNEIDLFYGQVWLTDFYGYIPRGFFPNKPYVYGLVLVNEHFFPGAAEATNTPAFGGPIPYFADFGVLGVILAGIMNIGTILETILYYVFYKNTNIMDIRYNSNRLYIFIWLLAPAFMNYFGSILSLFLFFLIVKTISIINRIKLV
jgi:putative O-antigen polymerase